MPSVFLCNESAPTAFHGESVCVAIPCAPQHWGKPLRRALRSVALQTYVHLVTEVVIVLSVTSRKTGAGRLNNCTRMGAQLAEWVSSNPYYSLRTRLVCSSQSGFTRGHNRNLGARTCRSNWLAYLDADDEMQPDRVERMLWLLDRHKARLGIHSYSKSGERKAVVRPFATSWMHGCPRPAAVSCSGQAGSSRSCSSRTYGGLVYGPSQLVRIAENTSRPMFMGAIAQGKTHHGHVFVHQSVTRSVKWSESMVVGEDVDFVRRAVDSRHPAVWTDEELTVYHSGLSVKVPPERFHEARAGEVRGGLDAHRLSVGKNRKN
jgi:glycosyltransferase involved in cell wall biosynthesis